MMVDIKLYGQQTSTYEYVKLMLQRHIGSSGIILNIEEVNDWESIVRDKVQSLPMVLVNGEESIDYSQSANIHSFINNVTLKVLRAENYGQVDKIVVPTDFSDTATNALVYAKGLNGKLEGIIQLVHVYKPGTQIDTGSESKRQEMFDNYLLKINQSWAHSSDGMLPIDGDFRTGFVVEELEEICAQGVANQQLIVIGSTGASGALKRIFGSVSTEIARSIKNPIVVVPPHATYQGIRTIVYALNNLADDRKVLPKVLDFCERMSADLRLVHVSNEQSYPIEELKSETLSHQPTMSVSYDTISGSNIASSLDDYASRHTADLITVVPQSKGIFQDLLRQSVTKDMVIGSSTPLLILHP